MRIRFELFEELKKLVDDCEYTGPRIKESPTFSKGQQIIYRTAKGLLTALKEENKRTPALFESQPKIKKIQLIKVGEGFSQEYQGSYLRFRVLIDGVAIEKLYKPEQLKDLPYWVNKSRVMAMTVWGSNQFFEAKYNLGRFLRLDEGLDHPDFCKRMEEITEVIE